MLGEIATFRRFAMNVHCARLRALSAFLLAFPMLAAIAGTPPSPPSAAVQQLAAKDVVDVPGKQLLMLTVEYPPGGASSPHRHDAQVFVYVLEGEVTMQVEGSAAVTLRPGETFYEKPDDVHLVSANASKTAPAKILVFILKDKNAPVSRSAAPRAAP
jgi:quercetin dioxygenase-like cupin family protein